MNKISKLKKQLAEIIDEKKFIDVNINVGNINADSVMNSKIHPKSFEIFKKFIGSKYKNSDHYSLTKYFYKDLKMVAFNNKKIICFKSIPSINLDYKLDRPNRNFNTPNLRAKIINDRIIDEVMFPSIKIYDNIEKCDIDVYKSRFKNSEIQIMLTQFDRHSEITFSTKIDKSNIDNFISNFEYILSKFYFMKISL